MESKVLVIGISGVTCSGKSTLASTLKELFPTSVVLRQDDYFFDQDDPRHVMCEEVDHVNYDIITSLDMEKMYEDIMDVVGKRKLVKTVKCEGIQEFDLPGSDLARSISEKLTKNNAQLIILDGFLLYAYEPFHALISLKYFLTLSLEECEERRAKRVYDPPDVPGYFEKCVWTEYVKHFHEVVETVDNVVFLDGDCRRNVNTILRDIACVL